MAKRDVQHGTLALMVLKTLEQEGAIASERGTSENNRRARFYRLTAAGRRRLRVETQDWEQTTALMDRFIGVKAEDLA
jgi:PadR family transcriptional regulator PadR